MLWGSKSIGLHTGIVVIKKNSSKAVRIVVNCCPVPRLVPYNRLMPFIKSIDIDQVYSVRDTVCQGLAEEETVDGMFGT